MPSITDCAYGLISIGYMSHTPFEYRGDFCPRSYLLWITILVINCMLIWMCLPGSVYGHVWPRIKGWIFLRTCWECCLGPELHSSRCHGTWWRVGLCCFIRFAMLLGTVHFSLDGCICDSFWKEANNFAGGCCVLCTGLWIWPLYLLSEDALLLSMPLSFHDTTSPFLDALFK